MAIGTQIQVTGGSGAGSKATGLKVSADDGPTPAAPDRDSLSVEIKDALEELRAGRGRKSWFQSIASQLGGMALGGIGVALQHDIQQAIEAAFSS